MKHDKIAQALGEVRQTYVAQAGAGKRKRRKFYWLGGVAAVLALVLVFLSWGGPQTASAASISEAKYPVFQRDARLQAQREAVQAYDDLAGFYRKAIALGLTSGTEANQAFSPVNLYMALSLAAELTGGDTRQQILDALGGDSIESLRAQAGSIWMACYLDSKDQTRLASSLWLAEGLPFSQEVMDSLAENYYTSVFSAQFGTEETNKAIAQWLDAQTGGLLKNQTGQVNLSPETLLALYATVYYQAKWAEGSSFREKFNTIEPFHGENGDIDCTFMHNTGMRSTYHWGEDYGAVALNLKDGSSMWLVLPDEGKTPEDLLSSGAYAETVLENGGQQRSVRVNLSVPKFDITATGNLQSAVEALGITDLFDSEQADFTTSLPGATGVCITSVNQATRVAMDEEGVTAASYIELPGAGAAQPPEEIVDFILDRPFLFVLTNPVGIPLFAGIVGEP